MNAKSIMKRALVLGILLVSSLVASAQSVAISVTTVSYEGGFAPNNIFAMWVTNSTGTYITTINRQAATRISHLTNWVAQATGGTANTDGTTGATLSSHITHSFTWNCKDRNGNLVPDGVYNINVEFTEANATGKYISFQFTKGATNQIPTLSGNAWFTNPSIVYTAPIASGIKSTTNKTDYVVSHVKDLLSLKYNTELHAKVTLKIYNLKGAIEYFRTVSAEPGEIVLNVQNLKGIYLLEIVDGKKLVETRKVVL